jgi:hypothetical protein
MGEVMNSEMTMSELLEQRRFPIAALALVAEIDYATAFRIVKGHSRPRGTTAVRMAEGLNIGYGRMRRILAATWEAGQAAQADAGSGGALGGASIPESTSC